MKRYDPLFFISILVIYFIISFPALYTGLGTFDEGQFCFAGMKVADGAVPYRDFFLRWTPGSPWLHALIFKTLGYEIIYTRIAAMAVDAMILLCILMMLYPTSKRSVALPVGVCYAFWGIVQCSYLWTTRLAVLFAIAALAVVYLRRHRAGLFVFFLAGVSCGVSFMFKQNIGGFALAAFIVYFAADSIEKRFCTHGRQTKIFVKDFLKPATATVSGFAVVFGAVADYFSTAGVLNEFLRSIFETAFKTEQQFMGLPNPFIGRLTFFVYAFGLGTIILNQISVRRQKEYTAIHSARLAAGITMPLVYYSGLLSGGDFTHVALVVACMFVLMGVFFDTALDASKTMGLKPAMSKAVIAAAVACAVVLSVYGVKRSLDNACTGYEWEERTAQTALLELPRASMIKVSPERKTTYLAIADAVENNTVPGDCVFVFPYDVMFNFLLDRDNCMPFTEIFYDGLTQDRVDTMIRLLDEKNIRLIILKDRVMPMQHSFHGSPFYFFYPRIYDYIETNYKLKEKIMYWNIYIKPR